MTAVQQFTKPFKRLFDKPLDIDQVFNTLVDMDAYLSSGNRYAGQIVSCLETNAVYILNETKDAWVKSGGDDIVIHDIDDPAAHRPTTEDKRGKILTSNQTTGHIEWTSITRIVNISGYAGYIPNVSSTHQIEFYMKTGDSYININIYHEYFPETKQIYYTSAIDLPSTTLAVIKEY
jgi:hypothetical protein